MSADRRFTLEEAAVELARRECRREGHDLDIVTTVTLADQSGQPIGIDCRRCGAHWKVAA